MWADLGTSVRNAPDSVGSVSGNEYGQSQHFNGNITFSPPTSSAAFALFHLLSSPFSIVLIICRTDSILLFHPYIPRMHQREPAPYTWLTQLVHQVARRWHRGFTFLGIAFVITTTAFWAWGGPAWEKAGAYTKGRFATSHERYGSDWRTPNDPSLIPPKIWQILLSKKNTAKDAVGDPANLKDTLSWVTKNTDYA